jgi:serine/threonine-protein kinase PknK
LLAGAAASRPDDLDQRALAEQILEVAIGTVSAARGILWIGKGPATEMVPAAARSGSGADLDTLERISRTILLRGQGGEITLSADAMRDPNLKDIPSVRVNEIRSIVCVPMALRGERVGVIYLDHADPRAFPRHTRAFLEAFASLAAVALENARMHTELRRENARMRQRLGTLESFGRIVTASPLMHEAIQRAAVVSQVATPLLLLGESGTGKELLARAIHDAGPRTLHPFIAFNCAAVPRDLMENLFFGHVRGAFTGALRDTSGLFFQADRGTLLLDEIAELDVALQAKLLRVLQDGMVRPVGADREFMVDVRVITATSRNLLDAVQAKAFREDLYYRLNVLELRLPPLRNRMEDIPILVDHFMRKHGDKAGPAPPMRITDGGIAFLQTLPWRGNVRELENLVQRAIVLCGEQDVTEEHLRMLMDDAMEAPVTAIHGDQVDQREGQPTIAEQERAAILLALRRTAGNLTRAARLLGIHRNSLARRMQRLKVGTDARSKMESGSSEEGV